MDATEADAEDLALTAIDAGAEDFETFDAILQVYSSPDALEDIREALKYTEASIKSSEISMVPSHLIQLDDKTAMKNLRLLDRLEELDDVQRVFSNADFSEGVIETYRMEN